MKITITKDSLGGSGWLGRKGEGEGRRWQGNNDTAQWHR